MDSFIWKVKYTCNIPIDCLAVFVFSKGDVYSNTEEIERCSFEKKLDLQRKAVWIPANQQQMVSEISKMEGESNGLYFLQL